MKQVLSLTAALCLLVGMSYAAELVDDFESYGLGDVATVASPPWTATAGIATIDADIDDNQYVTFSNGGDGWGPPLQVDLPYEVTSPVTLFFRIRSTTTTNLDHAFGLTDNPAAGWFDQYGPYVRVVPGANDTVRLDGRTADGGGFAEGIASLNAGEWYNIWLVIDPTDGRGFFDVYYNQGSEGATIDDRVSTGAGFRKAFGDPLISFMLYGSSGPNTSVDDVYLMDGEDLSNPTMQLFRAHDPSPAHGAAAVLPAATLSWKTGLDPETFEGVNTDITHHYVYFKADDANFINPATEKQLIAVTGATGAYSPVQQRLPDSKYFWRVDQVLNNGDPTDPNDIIMGSVWSYSTILSAPVITGHPEMMFVDELGADAVIGIEFTTHAPVTPKWYKVVDGGDDLLIADGFWSLDYSKYDPIMFNPETNQPEASDGETYAKLTILNIAAADQARYYCEIINTDQKTDVSRPASLIIKNQLAHYPFENGSFENVLGSDVGVGKNYPDANLPGPTFAEGVLGDAALFVAGNYIDLGAGAFPNAGIGNGLEAGTISMWIKPDGPGNLMANLNDNVDYEAIEDVGTTGFAFSLASATQPRMVVRGESENPGQFYQEIGTVQGGSVNLVTSGNWHHVATTWQAGGHIAVYVDGLEVARINGATPDQFLDWQYGVLLGSARTAADREIPSATFSGLMDEVTVFNYPLDLEEMAQLYYDVSGVGACLYPNNLTAAYDLNGNCKIDLGDFVILASHWLECGRYPAETCNDY